MPSGSSGAIHSSRSMGGISWLTVFRENTFVQVKCPSRPLGGMRIMRDHDDRLSVIAIERLQQIENLVTGLAVEIASGFVAEEKRGVRYDRTGNADALLLSAGQLARIMLSAICKADDLQRNRDALSPLCFG